MLCNCDCGEKFTGISFESAFTDPLSIRRTEKVEGDSAKVRKCKKNNTNLTLNLILILIITLTPILS